VVLALLAKVLILWASELWVLAGLVRLSGLVRLIWVALRAASETLLAWLPEVWLTLLLTRLTETALARLWLLRLAVTCLPVTLLTLIALPIGLLARMLLAEAGLRVLVALRTVAIGGVIAIAIRGRTVWIIGHYFSFIGCPSGQNVQGRRPSQWKRHGQIHGTVWRA